MNFLHTIKLSLSLICVLALFPLTVQAGLAGHVILTKGNVSAVSDTGEARKLKRRAKIMSGDIIKTGINSSIQIRFIDKALMTIKANSEMNITDYQLANPSKKTKDKALMNLVKGGFRTISGQIGKGDKSAYKVDTPAASIGIRGTNYEVQQEPSGDFVMAVYSGGISVKNESGSIELGLGSDFNFTRVASNGAPKGLLIAPETLTENSATDEPNDEESDNNESSSEESSESDGESEEESGNESTSDDSSEEDSSTDNSEDSAQEFTEDIAEALDEKLTEELQENKDKVEVELIAALQAAGILNEDENLNDLSQTEAYVIGNTSNSDDAINLALNDSDTLTSAIDNTMLPSPPSEDSSPFIQSLYDGITTAPNPFSDTTLGQDFISDQEYNLAASDKLAILAMPMNFSQDASGELSFDFGQASVGSPNAVNSVNNYATSLAASTASIDISYTILDTSNSSEVEVYLSIPITIAIDNAADLQSFLSGALTDPNLAITLNAVDASTSVFEINSNAVAGEFITEMKVNFSGTDGDLLAQMMGGSYENDDWRDEADIDLMIASGAWHSDVDSDGNPIFVMSDTRTETFTEDDGSTTTITLDRNEVIKPHEDTVYHDNLLSFALCGDQGNICSIQVLKDNEKIRWGAWLTEPGKGIQILNKEEISDGSVNTSIHEENQILAFWIAAERADINTLIGDATFSTTDLDCTDFSQCIGFADDGIVQNLSGQFDVNFTTGDITNGNLNIEVSDDSALLLGNQGTAISTWNVSFSGEMAAGRPEFTTHTINGTVVDENAMTISTEVIGNIGGIIVNPGDKVAGGYNLGTADGTDKHVSGVFTLDKQP